MQGRRVGEKEGGWWEGGRKKEEEKKKRKKKVLKVRDVNPLAGIPTSSLPVVCADEGWMELVAQTPRQALESTPGWMQNRNHPQHLCMKQRHNTHSLYMYTYVCTPAPSNTAVHTAYCH